LARAGSATHGHTPSRIRVRSPTFVGMSNADPLAVPRAEAARLLGLSPATLRGWSAATPPRGPRAVKLGAGRQARALYPVSEIREFLADPQAYERSRRSPPNAHR